MATNDDLKTASVLAFERKLDPSDALYYSGSWDNRDRAQEWSPIAIREKSVRGTISNRLSTKDQDPAKLDASIQSPNLQTVDVATLPGDADTLQHRFTLKVLSGAGTPSACNNNVYQQKLKQVVDGYVAEHGFGELARRYAVNVANGRFLWRNRIGAEQVAIHVRQLKEGAVEREWQFDGHAYPLRSFDSIQDAKINELAGVIAEGLAGENYLLLEVTAYARMGKGQEIFPSQELLLDKGTGKGGKSKTLYSAQGIAAMHSQKVGNALRTIDTWYPDPDGENLGPIAIEPYGSVTSLGRAFRQPKEKNDFYTLLDGWIIKDKVPDANQQHYVMAILIRGGVFGKAEKE